MRRIDRVDDRAQPESEIPRRREQRGQRLGVAASGARDQVVHVSAVSAVASVGSRRVAPEVARQRGEVRDVGLPASGRAAPAARAIDVERHVAELAGDVVLPADQLAAEDHADAEAVGDRDVDEVARRLRRRASPRAARARTPCPSSRSGPAGPRPAASGSRRLRSRQPRFGASSTRPASPIRPCPARRRRRPGSGRGPCVRPGSP